MNEHAWCTHRHNSNEYIQEHQKTYIDMMHIQPGDRVIDLGCGPTPPDLGRGTTYCGVDTSINNLMQANSVNPEATFYLQNAETFDKMQGTLVICRRMLIWCDNPYKVIKNAHDNLLVPGGRMVSLEPDWRKFWVNHTDGDPHYDDITNRMRSFNTMPIPHPSIGSFVKDMMEDAGFTDIHVVEISETVPMEQAKDTLLLPTRTDNAIQLGLITSEEKKIWLNKPNTTVTLVRFVVRGAKLPDPHRLHVSANCSLAL